MQNDMQNKKTAIITGASGDIGSACAYQLCKDGYNVILCYHSSEKRAKDLEFELTSLGFSAHAIKCDVTSYDDCLHVVNTALELFSSIDLLVTCAGVSQIKQINDISEKDFSFIFDVNVKGVFNAIKSVVDTMIKQKSGKIINISSIWGICGASCESHYSASKAAVIGLTKALSKELGLSGITVNAVAPGVIDTHMNAHLSEETLSELKNDTPLMRLGTPFDVACAVSYLASPGADFVTGQVINVSGGFVI